MNDLKVGIVEPVGGHGGMNYYDYGLALGLAESNVEVHLYTSDKTRIEYSDKVKTHLFYKNIWGDRNKISRLLAYFKSSRRVFRNAKEQGIKVLHFHFFDVRVLEYFDMRISSKKGFKKVVTIHDIETFQQSTKRIFSLNKLDRYIDQYIVHNETSKAALIEKYPKTKNKINVVPHGNYEQFISNEPPTLIDLELPNQDYFTLLFFGQIKDVKGLDVLLDAIGLCHKRNLKIQLVIAGKTWQSGFDKYEQQIQKLNIESLVTTSIKYIPDNEVASYFELCDLVVLPYKHIYQSGVLLMTMSYEKPVLVSDLEAMQEIIKDGVTGFTFENGNSTALANKIQSISERQEDFNGIIEAGKIEIRSNYNWAIIAKKIKRIYATL